ncbi:hypothetical protein [Streptococcus parasuis]|jgi:hypothetical protein|uniref:hypothetical protein n=1 Tax=Streptococcus parasuis TaxID=1501662 RepID=UPI00289A9905|nr:hypothetical protein [Streptococcus parasuis]
MKIFKKVKKSAALLSLVGAIGLSVPAVTVLADTVYYNGTAIYWSHGRTAGVYSYSTVQTSVYTHGATANSTFSGWKSPGVTANAKQYVGLGQAVAYWNVK